MNVKYQTSLASLRESQGISPPSIRISFLSNHVM